MDATPDSAAWSGSVMSRKALQTIEKYKMLGQGDAVLVGLSGGADSVALLCFLQDLAPQLGLRLAACHINHNLRGAESLRDEQFVRLLCDKRQIPLEVFSIDAAAKAAEQKMTVEEASRQLRYHLLERAAKRLGGQAKIATAHTLSDNVETVLFYMARGTGLSGLCGIPPVRRQGEATVIRPLIDCTREEIERYCAERELSYVTDSTNLSDDYTRNRIRHRVVPEFREINPAFYAVFARMLQNLQRDETQLSKETGQELKARLGSSGALSLDGWELLSPSLQHRLVLRWLKGLGIECDSRRLELMLDCFQKGQGAVQLQSGAVIRVQSALAWLSREKEEFCIPLAEGTYELGLGRQLTVRRLNCEQIEKYEPASQNLLKNCVDCDKIRCNAVIRNKKPGDRLSLPHRAVGRLLKKLCNDLSVPMCEREAMPVLEDTEGVAWVYGLGADRRVIPDFKTKQVFCFSVKNEYCNGFDGFEEEDGG